MKPIERDTASLRTNNLRRAAHLQRSLIALAAAMAVSPMMWGAPTQSHTSSASKVYKWTDDKGVVHFGDAVPPQYADQEQTVLNHQGVAVGVIAGRRSAEQLAADDAHRSAEESALDEQKRSQLRDQNLLATYLSVEEIESLRDRRLEILEGQARVITQYLDQLKTKTTQLEEQMRRFRPYAANSTAAFVPQRLAEETVRNINDVRSQQRALISKQDELKHTREQFADDIARFRELKEPAKPKARPNAR